MAEPDYMPPAKRPRGTEPSMPMSAAIVDLTDSPPSKTLPRSDRTETSEALRLLNRNIGNASVDELRSAIMIVCTQLPEAAQLLGPLLARPLTPDAIETGRTEKKRKLDVATDSDSSDGEICGECGEKASVEDAGCCKWRMMRYYERRAAEEELAMLDDNDDDICDEYGGNINDNCCKAGMMKDARKYTLKQELSYDY